MGERDDDAAKVITQVTGHSPRIENNDEGTIALHIGDVVLTAEIGLWSDPTAFLHTDALSVTWAGHRVFFPLPAAEANKRE